MKRFGKVFLVLALAALMLLDGFIAAGAAGTVTESGNGRTAVFWNTGNNSPAGGVQGEDASGAGMRLESRSKKKKKNTEAPTATPAPAAERTETGTKQESTGAAVPAGPTATPVPEGPIIDPQSIADYLFAHDMRLPDNFITKKEAQELGWGDKYRDVSDAAPGKSIGGDYFGNYQGRLPTGKGITYHEADCYYTKGKRNAYRVIYSSDGRVWYTEDHYNTFTELFPTVP